MILIIGHPRALLFFSFFPEVQVVHKRKLFKLISSSATYTLRDFVRKILHIGKKFYFNVLFD